MDKKIPAFRNNRLGAKLLCCTLVIISLSVLIIVTVGVYRQYLEDSSRVYLAFDDIKTGFLDSLAVAIWQYDLPLIDALLQGIDQRPSITHIKLQGDGIADRVLGVHPAADTAIFRDYPIVYRQVDGELLQLGHLQVAGNRITLLTSLQEHVLVVAAVAIIQVLLISLPLLMVFYLIVTKRVQRLSAEAAQMSLSNLQDPISVSADSLTGRFDELTQLSGILENLRRTLRAEIDERQVASLALEESEKRYKLALAASNDGLWDWDVDSQTLHLSDRWYAILGLEKDAIDDIWEASLARVHPDDIDRVTHVINDFLAAESKQFSVKFRVKHTSGDYLHILGRGQKLVDSAGEVKRCLGTLMDMSPLIAAENMVSKLSLAMDVCPIQVAILDNSAYLEYCNRNFRRRGAIADVLFSSGIKQQSSIVQGDIKPLVRLRDAIRDSHRWQGEIPEVGLHDKKQWSFVTVTPIPSNTQWGGGCLILVEDITARKALETSLLKQAYHDALTGLANRAMAKEQLEFAIDHARRNRLEVGILFVDLDDFKIVNDSMGHEVGDQFLIEVAKRLKSSTRASELVARLGGDEFIILVPVLRRREELDVLANRILSNLAEPAKIADCELYLSASIGISVFPDDGRSSDELIQHADTAMYRSKGAGKSQFHFFSPEMKANLQQRLALETGLRKALEFEEFEVFLQPIVDLSTGGVQGAECLIRWNSETLGLVMPDCFIPIAEKGRLINEIDHWVMERSTEMLSDLRGRFGYDGYLTINIASTELYQETFVEDVKQLLQRSDIPAERLQLEITERTILDSGTDVLESISQLDKQGVRLCIDDFGTGYSALNYLVIYPFLTVKIDRSLICNLENDDKNHRIIGSIISMVHKLGMKVVAEGIENEAQKELLEEMGCDLGQGYFLGRPMNYDGFTSFLSQRH